MTYLNFRKLFIAGNRKQDKSQFSLKILLIAFILLSLVYQGCKKEEDPPQQLGPIVLDCKFFETDQVLVNDPNRAVDYQVTCVAQVDGEITINAGVVIEFEDDAGLYVDDGYLKAVGSSSSKVIFTGVNKVKGSWRGIFFDSEKTNNILEYAVVSYAGGNSFNVFDDRANIVIFTGAKVTINNCEINNGKEHGVSSLYRNCEILGFSNNIITGNDKYPVVSLTEFGHMYSSTNSYTGNGTDFIFLDGSYEIRGERTWEKNDIPYLIEERVYINDNQSLTIMAGAKLFFEDQSSIYINKGGYLFVDGSEGELVLLSGMVAQPGSWLGVYNGSSDQRNVINYAEIAYAGGGQYNVFGDLGTIVCGSKTYTKVTNTYMRDADQLAECAINAPHAEDEVVVENNTLSGIAHEVCDAD